MPLTVEQYNELLKEHGSLAAVARHLNRDQRNLRRWVKRNVEQAISVPSRRGDDPEALLSYLRKPRTITELAERIDRSEKTIHLWLDELEERGYNIHRSNDLWSLDTFIPASEAKIDHQTDKLHLTIGITADVHECSKQQQLSFHEDFYTRCEDRGVENIYDAGDTFAGVGVYRGQDMDIFQHTEEDQLEYVAAHHPKRKGITTHKIGGNHDLVFVKNKGADPVKQLALMRPDIKYLGAYSAWIKLAPGCELYMVHPDGGSAYATSYKAQKLVESFEGGRKPNIAVIGHYHKKLYLFERNVHVIMPGCWEAQTNFGTRRFLQPQIGGVILDIWFDDHGAIQTLKPEFVSYLIPKEHDYD